MSSDGSKLTNYDPRHRIRAGRGYVSAQFASATINVSDTSDPDADIDAHSIVFTGSSVTEGDDGEALVDLTTGVKSLLNNSGAEVSPYTVVVNDPTADDAFTTTTTAQVTDQWVGVTQATIAAGEVGPVMFTGYTPIQVDAAATRGDYVETGTTAGNASTSATRRAGSFGVILTGADPNDAVPTGTPAVDSQVTLLSTAGTSLTIDMPTTRPNGVAYLLALYLDAGTSPTITGWTLIGAEAGFYYFYRTGSSEPATYSASWTGSSEAVAIVVALDPNVDTSALPPSYDYDATTAAATVTGLADAFYLAVAGLGTTAATPDGWELLASGSTEPGAPTGSATVVQSVDGGWWQTGGGTVTLASPVTAGNLLILAEVGGNYFGLNTLNTTPYVAGDTSKTRAFTPWTTIDWTTGAYGTSKETLAYRVATGDEQSLQFSGKSFRFHVTVYEVSNAGDPTGFEVLSKALQAASASKSLDPFGTPGDLQIMSFAIAESAPVETVAAGWTEDYQGAPPAVAEKHVVAQASTGPTPSMTGGTAAWGGIAVGITGGASVPRGMLVAQYVDGTSATSPFTGAGAQNDAIFAFALIDDPIIEAPTPTALINVPDSGDGLSTTDAVTIVRDTVTTVNPAAELLLAPQAVEDDGGGVAHLHLLTSREGEQHEIVTVTDAGASETLDLSAADTFDLTLTAACTLTFSNPPAAGVEGRWTIIARQGGTGSYALTWPGTVSWADTDGTPTTTPPAMFTAVDAVDVFKVTTLDGGTSYGAARLTGAAAASFATPSIVLGSSAAAGAATTVIRSDSTIAAFDATAPVTQAFGDSAATGSAAFAARRDHKHGMPSSSGIGEILISDTPSTPLVFADLIQNEAQDDLVYADP